MYYDKQIRYIDYLENGEKKRNCGYVKATVTGGRMLLEMWIRDLYETDDVTSEVVLEGGGAESRIGTVQIRQGSGSFRWECMDRDQEGTGMALGADMCYGQLERIYVQLSPRRSLRCIWRTTATAWENDVPALAVHDTEKVVPPETGAARQPESMAVDSEMSDLPPQSGSKAVDTEIPAPQPQLADQSESIAVDTETLDLQPQVANQAESITVNSQTPDQSPQPTRQPENMGRKKETPDQSPQQTRQPENMGRKKETPDQSPQQTRQPENMGRKKETPDQSPQPTRQPENMAVDAKTPEPELQSVQHSENIREEVQQPETLSEGPNTADKRKAEKSSRPQQARQTPHMASMSEDKWQQLQKIYPHIRPFQDEREYLSLRPEDFVILHSSSYRLVQNSFLLHGYFNYDHLILTCVSQKNGDQYYIGVPGNFFEKEKQVAIMYGFESFECRQEPAGEGEFGYYMIRVEL